MIKNKDKRRKYTFVRNIKYDREKLNERYSKSHDYFKDLLEYIEDLESALSCSGTQIHKHLNMFSPNELECMAQDDVLDFRDIPEDKRTRYVKEYINKKC